MTNNSSNPIYRSMSALKILTVLTLILPLQAFAESILAEATKKTAYEIMQAVKQQSTVHSNQRYDIFMEIEDDRGRKRTRYFESWNKHKEKKSLGLIRFYDPASLKGTALLSSSANDENTVHQWIYLPALNTVKKLSSADKNGSFMGSDFSNADVGGRDIDGDTHRLASEDEQYYHIESIPKAAKDNYGKLEYKILKKIMFIRHIAFYDKKMHLLKTLRVVKARKHKQMYVSALSIMENPNKDSKTTLTLNDINTDLSKKDSFFSTRGLRQ